MKSDSRKADGSYQDHRNRVSGSGNDLVEEAALYLEPTQPFEFIEQLLGNSQVARCSGIHPPARS